LVRRRIVWRWHRSLVRSGNFFQAGRSSSCGNKFSAGSLRSTGVTPLRRYYEPLRLPTTPDCGYVFPQSAGGNPHRSSPRGRVSQVPDRSVDARRPQPPRGTWPLHVLVARRPMTGFTRSGRVGRSHLRNEAETGSLALRLTPSPSKASHHGSLRRTLGRLHAERAIHMSSSFQLNRPNRLT
jgi:hypothetical protein